MLVHPVDIPVHTLTHTALLCLLVPLLLGSRPNRKVFYVFESVLHGMLHLTELFLTTYPLPLNPGRSLPALGSMTEAMLWVFKGRTFKTCTRT